MIYAVLIDGEPDAYGVTFPDLPGCTAMGATVEEALVNAAGAARDWARTVAAHGEAIPKPRSIALLSRDPDVSAELAEGAVFGMVPLVQDAGRPAKANLSLDAGVLEAIDAAPRRTGRTRSAMVETLAHVGLPLIG